VQTIRAHQFKRRIAGRSANMATTSKPLMTADEFWELPEKPDTRLELVNGEVVEMPAGSMRHAALVGLFYVLLHTHVSRLKLGHVFVTGPSCLLRRDPDSFLLPDVSYFSSANLPDLDPHDRYVDAVPGLVVEVISARDRAYILRRRIRNYVEAGVGLLWIVWPDFHAVSVYAGSITPTELTSADMLDGGDVLPGFSVKVAELFDIEW
jgi:Uma2 family endonuclease